MNDLRRGILWLTAVFGLVVAIWGFQWHELSSARPFAAEYRWFRLTHRIEIHGHTFYLPWRRMVCAWGAIVCLAAALWPLATGELSRRWLGRWERSSRGALGRARR